MQLLGYTSFPVIALAIWLVIEASPFVRKGLRNNRWWQVPAWFSRPLAFWSVFSIIYRFFAKLGFNDRTTFPFYFEPWHPGETWTRFATRLAHSQPFWWSSLLVILLSILFLFVCRWIIDSNFGRAKVSIALSSLVLLSIALSLGFDAAPGGAKDPLKHKGSFLHMWFDSGNTMLYAMPLIHTKGYFLRNFEEIQPKLKNTIHGADHPPGATLALFWLGRLAGARERISADRMRYALATTIFASFSVLAMFFLGYSMFGSFKTGLVSAAIWAVKPATIAYSTFSPDTVYWVFFILWLALSWRVTTSEKRPYGTMVLLGLTLSILTMLNYNWPLLAGMFGFFLSIYAWRNRWTVSEWFWRAAIPAAIGLLILIWICVSYKLDYISTFLHTWETCDYYDFHGAYRWTTSLIGGQIDICILTGSLAAYLFLRNLKSLVIEKPMPSSTTFLLIILALYMLTIFLTNILKIETSRIWAWITAVPIVVVARWVEKSEHPRFYFLAIIATSLLQYYCMRTFLVSCG